MLKFLKIANVVIERDFFERFVILYHLSADDETSNVLKRSVKNVRSRFGSLLYTVVSLLDLIKQKLPKRNQYTSVV